jgi:hypothetical protein
MTWSRKSRGPKFGCSVVLAMQLGALSGCGQESAANRNPLEIITKTESLNKPWNGYRFENAACQSSQQVDLQWLWMPVLEESEYRAVPHRQEQKRVGLYFESPMIEKITHGRRFWRECPAGDSKGCAMAMNGLEGRWHFEDHQEPMKLCQSGAPPLRHSYEAVASSLVLNIQRAADRVEKVLDGGVQLGRVVVDLLPTYETRAITAQRDRAWVRFITDNLSYTVSSQTITVFPESQQRMAQSSGQPRLWESAFVVAHEYAHHVENQLFANLTQKLNIQWNEFEHQFLVGPKDLREGANAKVAFFVTAMSEAFADLLALYVNDGSAKSISEFRQLGDNRDPKALYYRDGNLEKRLNATLIKSISNQFDQQHDTQSFAVDAHEVGAVVAHVLHSVWQRLLPTQNSANSSEQKFRVLLAWTVKFQRAFYDKIADSPDQLSLKVLLDKFGETLLSHGERLGLSEVRNREAKGIICNGLHEVASALAANQRVCDQQFRSIGLQSASLGE